MLNAVAEATTVLQLLYTAQCTFLGPCTIRVGCRPPPIWMAIGQNSPDWVLKGRQHRHGDMGL